jgi:hypothetical protein
MMSAVIEGLVGVSSMSWFDDTTKKARYQGVLRGNSMVVRGILASSWDTYDRNPSSGLTADLTLNHLEERSVGGWKVVSFQWILVGKGLHRFKKVAWLTQIYNKGNQLVHSGLIRSSLYVTQLLENSSVHPPMALSLDYTGYPVRNLEHAQRFYQNTMHLGSPYSDSDWFGFWSTSAVFGIYAVDPSCQDENEGLPRYEKTNGYASFWVQNAQNTFQYLKSQGSRFPVLPAINDVSGVDQQPGYTQVLASDSEGSCILMTEYTTTSVAFASESCRCVSLFLLLSLTILAAHLPEMFLV